MKKTKKKSKKVGKKPQTRNKPLSLHSLGMGRVLGIALNVRESSI